MNEPKPNPSAVYGPEPEHREKAFKRLPTVEELARLAACLEGEPITNIGSAIKRNQAALLIWQGACDVLGRAADVLAWQICWDAAEYELSATVPAQTTFPVPFEKFLRDVVGGKTPDRHRTYRTFLGNLEKRFGNRLPAQMLHEGSEVRVDGDEWYPARESMPPSARWGELGWTLTDLDSARQKLDQVACERGFTGTPFAVEALSGSEGVIRPISPRRRPDGKGGRRQPETTPLATNTTSTIN